MLPSHKRCLASKFCGSLVQLWQLTNLHHFKLQWCWVSLWNALINYKYEGSSIIKVCYPISKNSQCLGVFFYNRVANFCHHYNYHSTQIHKDRDVWLHYLFMLDNRCIKKGQKDGQVSFFHLFLSQTVTFSPFCILSPFY